MPPMKHWHSIRATEATSTCTVSQRIPWNGCGNSSSISRRPGNCDEVEDYARALEHLERALDLDGDNAGRGGVEATGRREAGQTQSAQRLPGISPPTSS